VPKSSPPFSMSVSMWRVNMLIASGYSGQTVENFCTSPTQEVVGVRIPSYASVSFTYRFGLHPGP
jgi:hypothetical protein